jgi:transcriptional regulator with XRE-family HTH domain
MLDFNFANHVEVRLELGQRLRAQRMLMDLSQQEVAERAGLSKGTVSNLESAGQGTLESLVRVVQALGLVHELQELFVPKPATIAHLQAVEQPQRKRVTRRPRL